MAVGLCLLSPKAGLNIKVLHTYQVALARDPEDVLPTDFGNLVPKNILSQL